MYIFYFFLSYLSVSFKPLYTIKVNYKWFTILILIGILTLAIVGKQFRRLFYVQKWKKANEYFENNQISNAFIKFEDIKHEFVNDYYFLFNYGSLQCKAREYNFGIKTLESAKSILTSYDLYFNLGNSYLAIRNYSKAEESFTKASNLIPYFFVPKYELFVLFKNSCQNAKANSMAMRIKNMPIKVYSPLVGQIKQEAIDYVRANSSPVRIEPIPTSH
jgi:tetratricopeptide (TPR) repeat protein